MTDRALLSLEVTVEPEVLGLFDELGLERPAPNADRSSLDSQ